MCPNCCEDVVLPVWLVWHLWSTEKWKYAHFKSLPGATQCVFEGTSLTLWHSFQLWHQPALGLPLFSEMMGTHAFPDLPYSSYGHVSEYQLRKYGEVAHPGMPQKHCYAWSSFSASMHWLIKKISRRTEPEDARTWSLVFRKTCIPTPTGLWCEGKRDLVLRH